MLFSLKNVRATYQRLMNKVFVQQIQKTMQVYVNDMLVKSLHVENHLAYLSKMFDILLRYEMKLNPNKCAFKMSSGKFLSFMVNQ